MEAKKQRDDRADLLRIRVFGEEVCEKLKMMYFAEIPWPECYMAIAGILTQLKKVIRVYYPQQDEVENMRKLRKFTADDIKEALALSKDKQNNTAPNNGDRK